MPFFIALFSTWLDPGCFYNRLSQIIDIGLADTSDVDTARVNHINTVALTEVFHLLRANTQKKKTYRIAPR